MERLHIINMKKRVEAQSWEFASKANKSINTEESLKASTALNGFWALVKRCLKSHFFKHNSKERIKK